MLLLFTPEDQLVFRDELGAELRALRPSIVSRRFQRPFLGYLQAQKQRLTGERGQKRIHRPELEEMYGFSVYGITPRDPLTLLAVASLLAGVAMLATYRPPAWISKWRCGPNSDGEQHLSLLPTSSMCNAVQRDA